METHPQTQAVSRPAPKDAFKQTNNSPSQTSASDSSYPNVEFRTENVDPTDSQQADLDVAIGSSQEPVKLGLPAASEDTHVAGESEQESQGSTTSSAAASFTVFPKPKTHVGPWQLGKTLGNGSSARVRLARHSLTHHHVAVKIVARSTCSLTQAGSLANLDDIDSAAPDKVEGMRRMPIAIEREVAILKLIEHPNVVKLYDVWENRNDIYLIMEYVEGGDLFEFISRNGSMPEEEALSIFRQIMSAIEYCHSYGICHRDLKPENILLKRDGQVKIADFGMAALHQGPHLPLWTSCGSPHYAAPELLHGEPYRGEKVDIWSMGVILFAMMAGCLPFDNDDMGIMLAKAKKGIYKMPYHFSDEAKDLIHRVFQTNPIIRISMRQMWKHPLVWKYGYLDELGGDGIPEVPDPNSRQEIKPLDLCNIEPQILRPLQAMWHTFSEDALIKKLIKNEPNDQTLFYWLLHSYREKQLENYDPSITYSSSDYHHVRPPMWSTKVSTRQFLTSKASGHGRSISKFTVISNMTEAGAGANLGTVRSYDPYKSSVKQPHATHARIFVHRDSTDTGQKTALVASSSQRRSGTSSSGSHGRSYKSQLGNRALTPRSTASSIQSSKQFYAHSRAGSRQKRAMDFSTIRKRAAAAAAKHNSRRGFLGTEGVGKVLDCNKKFSSSHGLLGEIENSSTKVKPKDKLHEELRHFSSSIAKDCDEAFSSSLLSVSQLDGDRSRQGSPFSLSLGAPMFASPVTPVGTPAATPTMAYPSHHPWDSRPLPPTPPSSSHEDDTEANLAENPGLLSKRGHPYIQDYDFKVGQAAATPMQSSRRVVSAPAYGGQQGGCATGKLPSIDESTLNISQDEATRFRNVSLPVKTFVDAPTPNEARGLAFLSRAEQTIRVVYSPSANQDSGVTCNPHSLYTNRPSSSVLRTSCRPVPQASAGPSDRDRSIVGHGNSKLAKTSSQGSASTFAMRKKTSSWFKRLSGESKGSKGSLCNDLDDAKSTDVPHRLQSVTIKNEWDKSNSSIFHQSLEKSTKKKSFFLPFWRNNKTEPKMSLAGPDYDETLSSEEKPAAKSRKTNRTNLLQYDDAKSLKRMVKPQQSWLARLFRVKPATRVVCLAISRRRARQEVAVLLRGWRKYGIRDIEVDKKRNVIFARLSSRNHIDIKGVSFACEFITVIEHGKRNHLSIIRFTQEHGAVSSLQLIVDTMQGVLRNHDFLVSDKKKAKMMIKTLHS